MLNKILISFILFLICGIMLFGEDTASNPLDPVIFFSLSDNEKVDQIKKWFIDEINTPLIYTTNFAKIGGRDIVPWLLEELLKYEYDISWDDRRLIFITSTLMYFGDRDLLSLYERYYIAGILEAKVVNYLRKSKKYDVLVRSVNSEIWVYINPNYFGQLVDELDEILIAKYKAMGLIE